MPLREAPDSTPPVVGNVRHESIFFTREQTTLAITKQRVSDQNNLFLPFSFCGSLAIPVALVLFTNPASKPSSAANAHKK